MRKYILSNILVNNGTDHKTYNPENVNGAISETSAVEDSTPDELYAIYKSETETRSIENSLYDEYETGPTKITRSIEDSDIDEFVMDSTNFTKSIENSDVDAIYILDTTRHTYTVEETDTDESEYIYSIDYNDADFDDILLI